MFNFIVFSIFCWFGLCVLSTIFISRQRKKTLLLRSFLKVAGNQNPGKWVADKGLPREYSIETTGFFLKIGKYLRKKTKNGKEITYYSYRMFVSTREGFNTIFNNNKRIAKTYNRIYRERKKSGISIPA